MARRQSLWRSDDRRRPFFAAARDAPRERTGSDVLLALCSASLVVALGSVAVPPSGFESALIGVVDAVPSFLDILWRLGVLVAMGWSVALVITTLLRRRGDVLVDQLATLVIALAAGLGLATRLNGELPSISEIVTGGSAGAVPLVGLAVLSSLNAAAAPHLARPMRRLGRSCVALAALSAVMLASTTPSGAAISVLLGSLAAALTHLAIGSGVGRPDLGEVDETLHRLGLETSGLSAVPDQGPGAFLVDARCESVGAVRVKVYGRDARDSQLLARIWRAVWFRGWQPIAASRLHQVEHEAFLTLLAAAQGVEVPEVVTAGQTGGRDALLVLGRRGRPVEGVDEVGGGPPPTEVVAGMWRTLRALHAAGIAHGAIAPDQFSLDGDVVVLSDLGSASLVVAGDQLRTDRAQLLVTTALSVGIERATVVAAEQLGDDALTDVLAYLQPAALGWSLRRSLKGAEWDLEALRSAAAGVVGAEAPELVPLRRVSPQTLVTLLVVALAVFALVSSLGGIDLAQVWDELRTASPGWAIAALLVAQLTYFTGAFGTRGASPKPLPYGPVVLLEMAIAFVALAVPSTAGRLALGIRFFQRQGVPPSAAVSISAIDSFSGFLVQAALLLLTLVVGVGHVQLDLAMPADRSFGKLVVLLGVAAVVLVVLVVLAFALRPIRTRILDRVRPAFTEVRSTLAALRSPWKLVQLFGGNLGNQVLFALALGVSLRAFGGELNLGTLIVVYVGAALFGGLMPVPGGIGVMEAALMAGLIAAGVEAPTASATALLFRAVTFYLPPLWCAGSMRWLQRNSYL